MATWALAEAKAKFSELVEKAVHEQPQHITKNGRPVAVLVSLAEWKKERAGAGNQRTTAEFFRASPLCDSGLVVRRTGSRVRDVEL